MNIPDGRAHVELIGESGYIIPGSKLACLVLRPDDITLLLPQKLGKQLALSHGVRVARSQNKAFACLVEPRIKGFLHDGKVAYAMLRQLVLACADAGLLWFYLETREPDLQRLVHKSLEFVYLNKAVGGMAVLEKRLTRPQEAPRTSPTLCI